MNLFESIEQNMEQVREYIEQRLDEIIKEIRTLDGASVSILTGENDDENRKLLTVAIYKMCQTYRCSPADVLQGDINKLLFDLEVFIIGSEYEKETLKH